MSGNGWMEMVIFNIANNDTQSCIVTDKSLDGPGDKWYTCINKERFTNPPIETYIKLNVTAMQTKVTVNQTWYCHGGDPGSL
jgi:hypothetical protein